MFAVNVDFAEEWELSADSCHVRLDLSVGLGFLSEELVARECKNFKASFTVGSIQIDKLIEIAISHSSLASDIDDEKDLTSVLLQRHGIAIDIGYRYLVNRRVGRLAAFLIVTTH